MKFDACSTGWIDVTRPMRSGMPHWPGDPELQMDRICDIKRGDACNVSKLTLCAHTGTHMDAPVHYLDDGPGMEAAPLDALLGPVRVLQCDDPVSIRRTWLQQFELESGGREFFKTAGSAAAHEQFREDYIYIGSDAAEYLAERHTRLVGIDTMSVGGFYDHMVETHVALLGAGCWIVENLDLSQVEPGAYEAICLPIKFTDCDGAPARVLLRPQTSRR